MHTKWLETTHLLQVDNCFIFRVSKKKLYMDLQLEDEVKKEIQETLQMFDWQAWQRLLEAYDVKKMQLDITNILQHFGFAIQWDVPDQVYDYNVNWAEMDHEFPVRIFCAEDLAVKLCHILKEYWSYEFRCKFCYVNDTYMGRWILYYTMQPDDQLRIKAAEGNPISKIHEKVWSQHVWLFVRHMNALKHKMSKQANITWITSDSSLRYRTYWKKQDAEGIPTYTKTSHEFIADIKATVGNRKVIACFIFLKSIWHHEGEWVLDFQDI
jgi:hypothetical protein